MIRVATRKLQRLGTRSWNLYRLSSRGNRLAESTSQGLREAVRNELTPEERTWVDRIERLRTAMNASTEQLTRTDYGAGTPDSNPTPEAMRAGVEVRDTLGHFGQAVSKPAFWCRLLFKLIRTVRPATCLEMGTALGISAAYQAAALELNGGGTLLTLEGAPTVAVIAKNNLEQLGLSSVDVVVGRFQDTLPDVLRRLRPLDYAFVDGHHDEHATVAYFEQISPFLAETSLLVFDDIRWSEGMRRAWHAVAHDPEVGLAVDLGPVGLCVVDRSLAGRRYFSIPLP